MSTTSDPARSGAAGAADSSGDRTMTVLVGAVVTLVTTPLLPLAPVVGGGVSGYLRDAGRRSGARAGALSGLVAAVPAVPAAWFLLGVFLLGTVHPAGLLSGPAVLVAAAVTAVFAALGAFGGALGAHLRTEL